MTFMQTGDIPQEGHHFLSGHLQFAANGINGVNLTGRGESRLTADSSVFASVGIGTGVNFHAGGGYKWVPYPDFAKQPAVGSTFSVWYGTINGVSDVSLRISPFVSKKFDLEFGSTNAYISIPFGITSHQNETVNPINLVLGGQFDTLKVKDVQFIGEIGINLHHAFNYFTVGATYNFSQNEEHQSWQFESP
jgi:hypothetical protein